MMRFRRRRRDHQDCRSSSHANAARRFRIQFETKLENLREFVPSVSQGLFWELNPGPLAPEARIMPLDQTANN